MPRADIAIAVPALPDDLALQVESGDPREVGTTGVHPADGDITVLGRRNGSEVRESRVLDVGLPLHDARGVELRCEATVPAAGDEIAAVGGCGGAFGDAVAVE